MELSNVYDALLADLGAGFSLVVLAVVGLVLVVWDTFRNDAPVLPWLAGLALAACIGWEVTQLGAGRPAFYGMVRVGGYASFINIVILGSALATVVLAVPYLQKIKHAYGEVYALILFATLGMIVLATANNLVDRTHV